MKIHKISAFFLIFCLFVMIQASSVHAEEEQSAQTSQEDVEVNSEVRDVYEGFDVKMPEIPLLTKEQIGTHMRFVEILRPWDDIYSGYRMFVPKTWTDVPDSIVRNTIQNERVMGEISLFYSNPNDVYKNSITVEAYELKHNISAKNWLIAHLLDYGYILEGISEHGWNRAEGLGVIYDQGDVDYKSRIVAILNGQRVIVMRYSTPFFMWEKEKSLQATVAKSFKLTSHDESYGMEMLLYDITGYADFSYPENWILGALHQNDFDRPRVRLLSMDDNKYEEFDKHGRQMTRQYSKGVINIQAVIYQNTGTSISEEIETQKELVKKMGVEVGRKLPHDLEIVFPKTTDLNTLDIYQGTSIEEGNDNYEVWIAYMKNDEAYYLVTMLTPNIDTRYFAWTENRSAFEAIVSSLDPTSFYEE